jgi:hypothetical protein
MRDRETLDSELRLVAALSPCRSGAGAAASIDVADALLDERREMAELGNQINPVRV